jgi:hypothetical protein
VLKTMFLSKLKAVTGVLLAVLTVGTGAVSLHAVANKTTVLPNDSKVEKNEKSLTEMPKDAKVEKPLIEIPDGPPQMATEGQKPMPEGGPVVLYSRNRHGNNPLASYSFIRGLRGDDPPVNNDVELVFGNRKRFLVGGTPINEVPEEHRPAYNIVAGIAFEKVRDEFQVGLHGWGKKHRIVDLGPIDFKALIKVPKEAENAESPIVEVQIDHVYVIRLLDDRYHQQPVYVKLKVLRHRDNDTVLFEWEPLGANKASN